jgi:hypothetical protein
MHWSFVRRQVALLALVALAFPAYAQHDCVPYQATPAGQVINSTWEALFERDNYQFTVPADRGGGYVIAKMETTAPSRPHMRIVPPSSQASQGVVAQVAPSFPGPSPYTLEVAFEVAAGATYYVEIFDDGAASSFPAPYTWSWTFFSRVDCYEPNDGGPSNWPTPIATSKTVPLNQVPEAYSLAGHLDYAISAIDANNFDWYDFTLANPTEIWLATLAVPLDQSIRIRLYDSGGSQLVDQVPPIGRTGLIGPTLLQPGTYYLDLHPEVRGDGNVTLSEGQSLPDHFNRPYQFIVATAPPAPTSVPFSISNFTGISTATDGNGTLSVGHGRIETTSGTTPSGVAIFGYRPAGVLVTEAGVPDSPLITSGRIYGEVSTTGVVNTGLAMANPNDQTATVTFTLTDTAGTAVRSGSRSIGPRAQVAGFLNEQPYSIGNGFKGTLSFNSTLPLGVIALRSLVNERSDFLITTLPVIDLSQGVRTGTQVVPHFAVGDGWSTQIILVNPSDSAQTGNVLFLGPGSGTTPSVAVNVNINGTAGSSAPYAVAPRSSQTLVVTPAATGLSYGSVRIVPANAGPVPTPLVIFGYKPGAFTLSEAGVPVTMGTAFRMYVEASAAPVILSGVAAANTTSTSATVTFEVMTLAGVPTGASVTRTIPPSGQIVGYLSDFFPNLPQPFQGVLRATTPSAGISVVALRQRYNERGDYLITTTPPTLETSTPTTAARSFPHFVNGDGYTTKFILFSGTAGQIANGNIRFYRQDGGPLPVGLR